MDSDYQHMPPDDQNAHFDDEMQEYMDQMDRDAQYDPDDGVNEQLNPDAFMYTNDEQAYEEDWIAHDHVFI